MGIFIQNLNDEKDIDVFKREASIADLAEPLGFD
jgi:hypothetical protein